MNAMRYRVWLGGLVAALWFAGAVAADDRPFREFGDYRVYYSAFNSSFVTPEVAAAYQIQRGRDRGLINIAVVPANALGGRPAVVSGHVANIFAQRQKLEFIEVREGDAVYYLAPFRFENEDSLTFDVTVKPAPDVPSYKLSFQQTFYRDR